MNVTTPVKDKMAHTVHASTYRPLRQLGRNVSICRMTFRGHKAASSPIPKISATRR